MSQCQRLYFEYNFYNYHIQSTMYAQVQLDDAIQKFKSYLKRINESEQQSFLSNTINGMTRNSSINNSNLHKLSKSPAIYSDRQLQKICNLATQLFIKYSDSQDFCKKTYEALKKQLINGKSYFLLYLLDQLLKNNKHVMKWAKKELDILFKQVWQRTFQSEKSIRKSNKMDLDFHGSNKNVVNQSPKLQNLKLMVKTWGQIYGQKYEGTSKKMLKDKYSVDLNDLNPDHKAEFERIYGVSILQDCRKQQTNETSINLMDRLRQLQQQERLEQKATHSKSHFKVIQTQQKKGKNENTQKQKKKQLDKLELMLGFGN